MHIDIEKAKEKKIKEIIIKTNEIITTNYGSQWSQFNIANGLGSYTTTDKTNYKNFVNDKIAQGKTFQAQVEAIETIEELQSYTFEFTE